MSIYCITCTARGSSLGVVPALKASYSSGAFARQLQEAKARLSELIKKAAEEGAQRITVHGTPAVNPFRPT